MVASKQGQLLGIAEQRPPAVPGHVHRRLVAGVEHEHAGPDELVLRQPLPFIDDLGQRADQVVPRMSPAFAGQGPQVFRELDAGLDGSLRVLLRRVQLIQQADLGRPGTEQVAVGVRHAQHLGDHRHGEGLGDRRDEVELSAGRNPVGQTVHDALDAGTQPLHHPRRERLRHEPAHPSVVRRLHVEDPAADEVPERPVPIGFVRAAHLSRGGQVMVRTAEPPIAKQRVHVLVSGDEPVVGGFVVKDRSPLAELGVDGVGGRDEGRVRRIKPELARGDALSEHAWSWYVSRVTRLRASRRGPRRNLQSR